MQLPAESVSKLGPSYDGRTVCVTGGAGFVGGHLVDALCSLGANVRVIDDLSNSTLNHLTELIELEPSRVRFIMGSILDDRALAEAVRGCSAVFHLAAVGSVQRSVDDPHRSWSVNATGTLRVLEAARAAGVQRVVYSASSSAYGDQPSLPKIETQLPAPRSPYAASKLAGEHLAAAWATTYGLSTVSLRYFNVFGPRQPAGSAYAAAVPAFGARLLAGEAPIIFGDGEQTRDFTYVANTILATLLAGEPQRQLHGQVINIGSGARLSLNQLATMLNNTIHVGGTKISPIHKPARIGDVRHSLADISRARDLLGYTPVVSMEQGLRETCDWLRQVRQTPGVRR